jgi:ATP-dependent RNA helicase DeaD
VWTQPTGFAVIVDGLFQRHIREVALNVSILHPERQRIESLKDGQFDIFTATDVVVMVSIAPPTRKNVDMPYDPELWLHRIGRVRGRHVIRPDAA